MNAIQKWWHLRKQDKRFEEWERKQKEFKLDAYEQVRLYVWARMGEAVPVAEGQVDLAFVDEWLFDLYEIVLPPQTRYTDVKSANDGYNNLMWRNRPVTYHQ